METLDGPVKFPVTGTKVHLVARLKVGDCQHPSYVQLNIVWTSFCCFYIGQLRGVSHQWKQNWGILFVTRPRFQCNFHEKKAEAHTIAFHCMYPGCVANGKLAASCLFICFFTFFLVQASGLEKSEKSTTLCSRASKPGPKLIGPNIPSAGGNNVPYLLTRSNGQMAAATFHLKAKFVF